MLMRAPESNLKRAISLVESGHRTLEHLPLSIAQLLARAAVAAVFWRSGQTKIANWDLTVQLFANEYHVPILPPDFAATLGTTFELACPVFLALGLATRLATLPLLGMTAIIEIFVYPQNWPEHLTWAALLVFLFLRGGGIYSLDHLIGNWLKRWR